jgi:glucoamylase
VSNAFEGILMKLRSAKSWLDTGKDDDWRRTAMIGAGALIGSLGLVWTARRLLPRLYIAPGWTGARPRWSPSDKVGVGTAVGPDSLSTSLVWFTLGHGAINEVFYPRMDHPCTRDLSLVVTDGRRFVSDERCDAEHGVEYLAEGVPAYRLINACKQGRYRIEKTVIAHPHQGAVLQRTRFTPLRGTLEDYHVYAILNPHLGLRKGVGASGWVGPHKGRTMLFSDRGDSTLTLASSAPWAGASVGYAESASDGWRDVTRHGRMTRYYQYAPRGNVLLTGEVDLRACGGDFVLVLGLGADPGEAGHRALAGVQDDFSALVAEYVRDWQTWQQGLSPLEEAEPGEPDLYRTSTMVLRVHEGKSVPGAIVASLSIPWGQAFSDERKSPGRGGYHMVWPRDLAQIGGGLLAAGARLEARRALDFLRDSQEEDGHWPQNMWTSGAAYWSGIQLGETAMAPLLADLLHREGALEGAELADFWPMVRKAAAYLIRSGPSTQEDRWEDERGFNPYTLSAMIAALLVAAELAEAQGESREAAFLRETADAWYSSIDYWTYVEDSKLARRVGVAGYYLRIAPPDDRGESAKHGEHLHFWYQGPRVKKQFPPAAIVSPDALAYVRFGLRAPDDPRIVNSAKVIDAITKVETPFGPAWHRYNHDGYGEKSDGSPFDGKHGYGRAWPLLAGERAHFELAAGRRQEAVRLLRAVERFAGAGGLIPEQVWDTYDIPEHNLYFGRPSGSAMPLAWAHAEYIKLRRSLHDGRIFDMPPQTVRRYLVDGVESPHVLWRLEHRRAAMPAGKLLRIELPEPAVIRWGTGSRVDGGDVPTRDSGLSVHYADLPTAGLATGDFVRFTIARAGVGLLRGAIDEIRPSIVRIEAGIHHHNTERRRHHVAAGAGADGAVTIR